MILRLERKENLFRTRVTYIFQIAKSGSYGIGITYRKRDLEISVQIQRKYARFSLFQFRKFIFERREV